MTFYFSYELWLQTTMFWNITIKSKNALNTFMVVHGNRLLYVFNCWNVTTLHFKNKIRTTLMEPHTLRCIMVAKLRHMHEVSFGQDVDYSTLYLKNCDRLVMTHKCSYKVGKRKKTMNDQFWYIKLGIEWLLCWFKPANCKPTTCKKGCSDRPDMVTGMSPKRGLTYVLMPLKVIRIRIWIPFDY